MGVLVLAKSCSEHHHHEVSAKKRIPGKCDVLCSSFYYLAHVPFRTVTYALLFAHYSYYASTFIVVQVRDRIFLGMGKLVGKSKDLVKWELFKYCLAA